MNILVWEDIQGKGGLPFSHIIDAWTVSWRDGTVDEKLHRSWIRASFLCSWMDSYPSKCRGLFPCSHGDNRRALPVDLCHLVRAIRDLKQHEKFTSLNITEHQLFCSFSLMRFFMRACGLHVYVHESSVLSPGSFVTRRGMNRCSLGDYVSTRGGTGTEDKREKRSPYRV